MRVQRCVVLGDIHRMLENLPRKSADLPRPLSIGRQRNRTDAVAETQEKNPRAFLRLAPRSGNLRRLGETRRRSAGIFLEEPPTDCYFIIITRGLNEMLPTIKSRCQISSLSPALPELIEEKIKSINPDLDAKKIASASMGSWGRCLRYIQEEDSSFEHEADFVDCLRLAFKAKKSKEAVIDLMAWSLSLIHI